MYCFAGSALVCSQRGCTLSPNGGGAIVSWTDDLWSSGMQKPLLLLGAMD